jgi:hypothetical protein
LLSAIRYTPARVLSSAALAFRLALLIHPRTVSRGTSISSAISVVVFVVYKRLSVSKSGQRDGRPRFFGFKKVSFIFFSSFSSFSEL